MKENKIKIANWFSKSFTYVLLIANSTNVVATLANDMRIMVSTLHKQID